MELKKAKKKQKISGSEKKKKPSEALSICLLALDSENAEQSKKLAKVLENFCPIEFKTIESKKAKNQKLASLMESDTKYTHLFFDSRLLNLIDKDSVTNNFGKICFFISEDKGLVSLKYNKSKINLFSDNPSINLTYLSSSELLRIIQLYFYPERTPGLSCFINRGDLIITDKIESLDTIGYKLDYLDKYIQQNYKQFSHRIYDFKQLILALTHEAITRVIEANTELPVIEFQLAISKTKIAFIIRFAAGKIKFDEIAGKAIKVSDLTWHTAWQSSDVLFANHYTKLNELEVKSVLFSAQKNKFPIHKSLIFNQSEEDSIGESLTVQPKDYSFKLLQTIIEEMSFNKGGGKYNNSSFKSGKSFGASNNNNSNETKALAQLVEKKNKYIAELQEKIKKEFFALRKKQLLADKKIEKLESDLHQEKKKLEKQKNLQSKIESSKETESNTSDKDIKKINEELKKAEIDKSNLKQKIAELEKKLSFIEKRESTSNKGNANKEKEFSEMKTKLHKTTIELEKTKKALQDTLTKAHLDKNKDKNKSGFMSTAGSPNDKKLKELQANEEKMAQAMKQYKLKLDNSEKILKATKDEADKKEKILQRQIEELKKKEKELMAKITDLSKKGKAA